MPDALDGDFSRSRAVLIGTWDYRHLGAVPAAEYSFHRMRSLLTSPLCGSWPEDRVSVVDNRARLGELPHDLVLWFCDAVDVALFYYVGHGQYDNDDRLCLALGDSSSDPVLRTTTSLTFDAVRLAFRASKAATKIAILDCCFAGLAAGQDSKLAGAPDTPRSPGFYLMMASGEFNTAWFETTAESSRPQTYFTKYLIDLTESGIPEQPAGLTLGPIFDKVADALVRDGKPAPGRRVSDHAADFVFARNRANPAALKAAPPYLAHAVFNSAPTPPHTQAHTPPDSKSRKVSSATTGDATKLSSTDLDADEMYSAAYRLESDWNNYPKNVATMESLYRTAAESGHTDAMSRLGLLLEGRTCPKLEQSSPGEALDGDINAAMYWYKEAARRGNIFGAFWLGQLYEDRLGNWFDALKWYETAANGGHQGAQAALDGLQHRLALGLGPLAHAHEFEGGDR
ncbi:peptidase C14 caspase catalytic subunit p20 [Streptomyces sp. HUCO-GS316]|uniref:caspase, EACC1-associated type n=1 Tax=Streptomyces sp. HUCO-GS316 TaxID=2692198 RepID=UPI00136A80FC|nr:caspase family protein [Streptomyces sp. HUCO-GS316]MXM68680.1 peptidase C14 caspase catalytic subunit p20 [Streptomyces sp. HUCO-GS316]